ncbi:MAG TPA: MurR/RpiR family transcriptional regulator [Verrucomicrobiae bacterium]|jgi:RpiR family transcriptional regulator, carbohydrate utilization regulator|nr:MurR/RpiR family transcriptional regulator [Verrucomicrobiae bacterium]
MMSQADRVSQLSARRREIIRPAFEDPRQFVLLSVRDMAKRLGTDPATMVRIARGLGFETYKQFQHYLHELSVVRSTSLDTMQSAAPADSSVKSLMRACLDQELKNFRSLYNGLDLNRVEAAARRIWKSRRIALLGGDAATCLVAYLEYHFNILGLPVFSATAPGQAVHIARSLTDEDMMIAISFRRGLRMTIEGIQQAKKLGAYCVGITDTYISPVARFCDETFLTAIDAASFGASYSAPVCFFNVFLAAIQEVQRTKSLQIMKKVADEQRHGFRFYDE